MGLNSARARSSIDVRASPAAQVNGLARPWPACRRPAHVYGRGEAKIPAGSLAQTSCAHEHAHSPADPANPPTSRQVWVLCMSCMNWMNLSCSLRWPFRRNTAASDADLARQPNSSLSGVVISSCQNSLLLASPASWPLQPGPPSAACTAAGSPWLLSTLCTASRAGARLTRGGALQPLENHLKLSGHRAWRGTAVRAPGTEQPTCRAAMPCTPRSNHGRARPG